MSEFVMGLAVGALIALAIQIAATVVISQRKATSPRRDDHWAGH